ncbi:hypothetical protein D3C78_1945970 [compost metagenome]
MSGSQCASGVSIVSRSDTDTNELLTTSTRRGTTPLRVKTVTARARSAVRVQ